MDWSRIPATEIKERGTWAGEGVIARRERFTRWLYKGYIVIVGESEDEEPYIWAVYKNSAVDLVWLATTRDAKKRRRRKGVRADAREGGCHCSA